MNWLNNTFTKAELLVFKYVTVITSLVLSVVLVFMATGKFTILSGIVTVIITGLIYLLLSSARGQNLEGSLPSVGYPIPPHLGLDGVSLGNIYPSKVGY